MIFVDVPIEAWLRRYPELSIVEGICNSCERPLKANQPFVTKGYAGLRAEDCLCGENTHTSMSLVSTSRQKHREWNETLNNHL